MTNDTRTAESLFRQSLNLLTRDLDGWAALFAPDAVFGLPYAVSFDAPALRSGREEIHGGMSWFLSLLNRLDDPADITVDLLQDRDAIVAQYAVTGEMKDSGKPFDQAYIVHLEAAGGYITRYVEYFDTLRFQRHMEA